ncbi:uncharacterized protein LOC131151305 [Malania oleifera]|uniref:uncharacterized protein LOC131151305 n=1 Tax=Malania oleifera TaxID=397392 RepID=UPI0025ADDDAD|nr:uncharacterized protein LOC131151305 [Malania oleifera]
MCNEEFFCKEPDEALSIFDYLDESAQQWNTHHEWALIATQPLRVISGGGRYEVKEETSLQAFDAALFKKIEVMESEKEKAKDCSICETLYHRIKDCQLLPVKINTLLLEAIQQILAYAKFLKDLCTVKRTLNLKKKAFLTKQVSALILSQTPQKLRDLVSPTISIMIGEPSIGKALLDMGSSVNLLSFSIYEWLGLSELKRTNMMQQLLDRSVKALRGVVDDVLVQVDKFYYPVDFVVLDMQQPVSTIYQASIILDVSGCDDAKTHAVDVIDNLDVSELLLVLDVDGLFENDSSEQLEEFDEKFLGSKGQIPEIDGTPHVLDASYTSSWCKPTFEAIDLLEIIKSLEEETPTLELKPLLEELK